MSSLSPVHTIGSQIIEAIRLHTDMDKKAARERMIELLRQVENSQIRTRWPTVIRFEFSGGMRQRFGHCTGAAG